MILRHQPRTIHEEDLNLYSHVANRRAVSIKKKFPCPLKPGRTVLILCQLSAPQLLFLGLLHDTGAGVCKFFSFASWNNFTLSTEGSGLILEDTRNRKAFVPLSQSVIFIRRWSPKAHIKGQGHFRWVGTVALAAPSGKHLCTGNFQTALLSSFYGNSRETHNRAQSDYDKL